MSQSYYGLSATIVGNCAVSGNCSVGGKGVICDKSTTNRVIQAKTVTGLIATAGNGYVVSVGFDFSFNTTPTVIISPQPTTNPGVYPRAFNLYTVTTTGFTYLPFFINNALSPPGPAVIDTDSHTIHYIAIGNPD